MIGGQINPPDGISLTPSKYKAASSSTFFLTELLSLPIIILSFHLFPLIYRHQFFEALCRMLKVRLDHH